MPVAQAASTRRAESSLSEALARADYPAAAQLMHEMRHRGLTETSSVALMLGSQSLVQRQRQLDENMVAQVLAFDSSK